ncbi:hypothetical protein NLJ89_g10133 [Agrocybe chaxingu]|uniref:Uncharacterized protein n=1 Tax=Agrocybe chaxingu TaxID=84603 RepID=A0A9W8MSX3_9AGAR|nr:hypothetical protein NLJ89_g10133 [Agrocybe chaxingu]
MNFGSPNCSLVATLPDDPLRFSKDSPVVEFPVNGGPSNPHMSLEFNGEVFVPDLGADKIWRLVNDGEPGKFRIQGQIDVAPGNGPRHIAIRDGILFTINELTSTLTAQQIPQAPNGTALPLLANVSIVPDDVQVQSLNASFFAAEILISEPSELFPDPLIYVSNRNLGPDFDPRGDSIAIFEFKNSSVAVTQSSSSSRRRRFHARHWFSRDHAEVVEEELDAIPMNQIAGTLTLQAQVFTGLRQIRSMAFGRVADGGDEFLIAGANLDGGVAVFRRVDGGRNLTEVTRNTELPNRTSFVFL